MTQKQILVPVAIASSCQYGCVSRQSDGRERWSVKVEAADQPASEVLRIGGATVVTGDQDLPLISESIYARCLDFGKFS